MYITVKRTMYETAEVEVEQSDAERIRLMLDRHGYRTDEPDLYARLDHLCRYDDDSGALEALVDLLGGSWDVTDGPDVEVDEYDIEDLAQDEDDDEDGDEDGDEDDEPAPDLSTAGYVPWGQDDPAPPRFLSVV